MAATLALAAALTMASASSTCPRTAAACAKDAACHAYGVYGNVYQLHGCADARARAER